MPTRFMFIDVFFSNFFHVNFSFTELAYKIFTQFRQLAIIQNSAGETPIHLLAKLPSSFKSRYRPGIIKSFVYSCKLSTPFQLFILRHVSKNFYDLFYSLIWSYLVFFEQVALICFLVNLLAHSHSREFCIKGMTRKAYRGGMKQVTS